MIIDKNGNWWYPISMDVYNVIYYFGDRYFHELDVHNINVRFQPDIVIIKELYDDYRL